MSRNGEVQSAVLQVEVVGTTEPEERAYAVAKMESLTQYAPIRRAHVVVGETSHDRGAVCVRVNVSGDHVLAHGDAEGATVAEAVDLVRQRLYRQLTRGHEHGHVHRAGAATRTP
jgi:ribosome-associated translation inhibitor RaiA